MMLCTAVAVLLHIWAMRTSGEAIEDLTANLKDVLETDLSDKCTKKEGCAVPYEGSKPEASRREICDALCRPLSCVWLSVENSTHMLIQCGRKLPRISKEKATTFLHARTKRDLEEECREGCLWEEVEEVRGSAESIREYMRWYICNRRSTCPAGQFCSVTGSYSHSNQLNNTCSVNGGWSDWDGWGSCSVTCGSGTRQRDRSCDNPTPIGHGADCAGSNVEVISCFQCDDLQCSKMSDILLQWCYSSLVLEVFHHEYRLGDNNSKCTHDPREMCRNMLSEEDILD